MAFKMKGFNPGKGTGMNRASAKNAIKAATKGAVKGGVKRAIGTTNELTLKPKRAIGTVDRGSGLKMGGKAYGESSPNKLWLSAGRALLGQGVKQGAKQGTKQLTKKVATKGAQKTAKKTVTKGSKLATTKTPTTSLTTRLADRTQKAAKGIGSAVVNRGRSLKDKAIGLAKTLGTGYTGYEIGKYLTGKGGSKDEVVTEGAGEGKGKTTTTKKKNTENQVVKGGTKTWKQGQEASKAGGGMTLNELVKARKGVTKGSPEYNKIQNQINVHLGSSKRHGVKESTASKGKTTVTKKHVPGVSTEAEMVKKRGSVAGTKKVDMKMDHMSGTSSERKTKGKSAVEGKKIKEREYDKVGNLSSKTKEKYGKKVTGAGDTGDWWTGRRKKKKTTTKTADTVTKTKVDDKRGTSKTKTRKRRMVKVGDFLAGRRSGNRTN
jgi:hypothetical protein